MLYSFNKYEFRMQASAGCVIEKITVERDVIKQYTAME
jgi:hypothetical protein